MNLHVETRMILAYQEILHHQKGDEFSDRFESIKYAKHGRSALLNYLLRIQLQRSHLNTEWEGIFGKRRG